MKTDLTLEDTLAKLRSAVGDNQGAWAVSKGVSPSYVSDVLLRRREPGKAILDALGLERITLYRRLG